MFRGQIGSFRLDSPPGLSLIGSNQRMRKNNSLRNFLCNSGIFLILTIKFSQIPPESKKLPPKSFKNPSKPHSQLRNNLPLPLFWNYCLIQPYQTIFCNNEKWVKNVILPNQGCWMHSWRCSNSNLSIYLSCVKFNISFWRKV